MFGLTWECNWEPKQLQVVDHEGDEIRFLQFIRKFRVFTARSTDWFYPNKRESKDILKRLVESGIVSKGQLKSDEVKITIYSCDPPVDADQCVKHLILEEIIGLWLEREPELKLDRQHVRIGERIYEMRVQLGEQGPSPGLHEVLWIGSTFEDLQHVVLEGQLATTLELWNREVVMQRVGNNWIPEMSFLKGR